MADTSSYGLFIQEPGDSNSVSYTDINQGSLGDCYFLSSVGELAILHPDDIKNMIQDDGNGNYTVDLYTPFGRSLTSATSTATDFQRDAVNVSLSDIISDGVQAPSVNGQQELWPELMEAAYAKVCGGVNNMDDGGTAGAAYGALSGDKVTDIVSSHFSGLITISIGGGTLAPSTPTIAITANTLSTDWAAGDSIVFDTYSDSLATDGLAAPHAYMFDGLTTDGSGNVCVVLKNPWGYANPAPIPLSLIQSGDSGFSRIEISQYAPNSVHVAPPASSIVLHVSEDVAGGFAAFNVSVDGVMVAYAPEKSGSTGATRVYGTGSLYGNGDFDEIVLPGSYAAGSHTISITNVSDVAGNSSMAPAPDLYVDSIAFGGQTIAENAEVLGNGTQSFSVGPVATPAPAPTPAPSSNQITLNVSEDAYQGDAQFTVAVDGVGTGQTYTATASHAAGQSGQVVLAGSYAAGAHTVSVDFINDAWGGSAQTDRNLYLDSITYQGQATSENAAFFSGGVQNFSVGQAATPAPTPAPAPTSGNIVLNVSEDAYQGDAQFTVSVDGVGTGQTYTATASHAAGQSGQVVLAGNYAAGAHNVSVNFINDAWGGSAQTDRNLYVNSITYAGQTSSENAAFFQNGTQNFAIGQSPVGGTEGAYHSLVQAMAGVAPASDSSASTLSPAAALIPVQPSLAASSIAA